MGIAEGFTHFARRREGREAQELHCSANEMSQVMGTAFPKECPFGAGEGGLGTRADLEAREQVPGAVPEAGLAGWPGPDVSQMLLTSCLAPPHLAFYVLVCFGLQTK